MKRNELLSYYKRSMNGGKSAIARLLDYLALRLMFFAACFFYFKGMVQNQLLSLFLSSIATAIFWIILYVIQSIRLDKFIQAKRLEVYEQYLRERLMLLTRDEFMQYVLKHLQSLGGYEIKEGKIYYEGEPVFLHLTAQPEPLTAGALLPVFHEARENGYKRLLVFCAGPVPESVRLFFKRAGDMEVLIFEPDALVRFLSSTREQDEEEHIDQILYAEIEQEKLQRKERIKHPLSPGRSRRYIIAALLLLTGSFFTMYSLYYRIMSGICLLLALITAILNKRRTVKPKPHDKPA